MNETNWSVTELNESATETNELATIQNIGEDIIVVIPNYIWKKLDIKEGSAVIIEPFICNGETGIRIKSKT